MTNIDPVKIAIKPCDSEALRTAEGRDEAEKLISSMEGADVSAPHISYTLGVDCIETSSSAVGAVEARLQASGLNREGGTEWYMEVEPCVANLPTVSPASRSRLITSLNL
jgi:hypothetical protein